MTQFRKKPVVIEAEQFDGQNGRDIIAWAHAGLPPEANAIVSLDHGQTLLIRTLEGTMHAIASDWIIKGVKGEFYPCKDDIFRATYDPVGMSDG